MLYKCIKEIVYVNVTQYVELFTKIFVVFLFWRAAS